MRFLDPNPFSGSVSLAVKHQTVIARRHIPAGPWQVTVPEMFTLVRKLDFFARGPKGRPYWEMPGVLKPKFMDYHEWKTCHGMTDTALNSRRMESWCPNHPEGVNLDENGMAPGMAGCFRDHPIIHPRDMPPLFRCAMMHPQPCARVHCVEAGFMDQISGRVYGTVSRYDDHALNVVDIPMKNPALLEPGEQPEHMRAFVVTTWRDLGDGDSHTDDKWMLQLPTDTWPPQFGSRQRRPAVGDVYRRFEQLNAGPTGVVHSSYRPTLGSACVDELRTGGDPMNRPPTL